MNLKTHLVFHRPTREEAIAKAAQYNLQEEVELAIDELGMDPMVALKEWDLL